MRSTALILALSILMACGSAKPLTVSATGVVVSVTVTDVTVVYETMITHTGDRIALTHHFPAGHSYRKGDIYPKH
jgi:hypothetical protein